MQQGDVAVLPRSIALDLAVGDHDGDWRIDSQPE